MALRGNLKELSLPDIFQLVTFSGKTGVLRIHRNDGAQGSVWFRDGDVFFASSNWHTDPLGQRLVRAQRITPMALERALELRAAEPEGGKRLGQILVEEGYITDKVLEAFVQEQMQDTIFDLMRWDEGDFEFEAMPEAPEEDIGLAVSIENVIMEGSRRLEEWNRIKKKIPSSDVVFKMATAPGEGTFEISLKPIEWNLLLLIDGSRSIAELAEATNRTDFEVARIVYGLFSAGLLEFATDDEVAEARAERTEREARLAAIEAEKAARAEREPEPESKLEPEPDAAPAAAPRQPAEVPRFLGAEAGAAGADSEALEAAMDALLATPPEAAPTATRSAEEAPVAEEPAFIGPASESVGPALPVESVEELLSGLTGVVAAAAGTEVEAPEAGVDECAEAELEIEAFAALEIEIAPEPEAAVLEPERAPEPTPEPEPAPEPAPEPEPTPERELPMPETTPIDAFEFLPVASAEAEPHATPAWEPPATSRPLEPGSYVVVPSPRPEAVPEAPAQEPMHWEPPQIDFDEDIVAPVAPAAFDLPMVPVTAPPAATDSHPTPPVVEPAPAEPLSAHVPEVVPARVQEPQAASKPAVIEEQPAVPEVLPLTPPEAAPAEPTASSAVPGLHNFEHDLMALGLGELPAELLAPDELPAEMPASTPVEDVLDLEPIVEPMGVSPADSVQSVIAPEIPLEPQPTQVEAAATELIATPEPEAEVAAEAQMDESGVDFSALLESLDISADDAEAVMPAAVETGPEPEFERGATPEVEAGVASAGVISTDAFLDDLSLEDEFTFKGQLTDELSALTGADRPVRPTASVNKIPDAGEPVLHRDARVDRETLMKIIHGIENL